MLTCTSSITIVNYIQGKKIPRKKNLYVPIYGIKEENKLFYFREKKHLQFCIFIAFITSLSKSVLLLIQSYKKKQVRGNMLGWLLV